MSTLNISNGLRLNNPNATGAADSFLPNANAAYGPYQSIDAAKNKVIEIYGENSVPLGVTVAVISGGTIKEYWNPTSKTNFVPKQQSSSTSATGATVTITESISEDTNVVLNSIAPNAKAGDQVIDTVAENLYICYEDGKWFKTVGAILTDSAPAVTRIVNANVLSYK